MRLLTATKLLLVILSLTTSVLAQSTSGFEKLEQKMNGEISSKTTPVSIEDFPEISSEIFFLRKQKSEDFNNQNTPTDRQVKQMQKLAKAYRDWQKEVAQIVSEYANADVNKYYKEVLLKYREFILHRADEMSRVLSDNASINNTFGEINDSITKKLFAIARKNGEYEDYKNQFLASLDNRTSDYIQLHSCISGIAKADNNHLQLNGYPGVAFVKFDRTEICSKYKDAVLSSKVINNSVGRNEVSNLTIKESENYKYDIEVTCSFGAVFGGMLITPNQQVPKCFLDLQRFLEHYQNIAQQINEANRLRNARNTQIQKNEAIRMNKEAARLDPVAQALNYAAGVPEDASGSSYFYPVNVENGQCMYKIAMDSNTPLGAMTSGIMDSLAQASKFASAITGQKDPADVLTDGIDLNKGDLKNINFYKLQGAQRNKFTGTTAYLRYQSRVEGLPDLFECDSNSCNIERLKRGWALVASKCKGTKKAF